MKQKTDAGVEVVKAAKKPAKKTKTYTRVFRPERAAEAIGDLIPNATVHGLTDGHYALVDVLQHCIQQTGSKKLTLSTWTATGIDVRRLYALHKKHDMDVVIMVDRSYITREPAYCAVMRELFGDDNLRTWNCHAKFAVLEGGKFPVLVTTSMNLAQNKRIENYQIETDEDLISQYTRMVSRIFEMQPNAKGFEISALGRRQTEQMVREIMDAPSDDDNANEVPIISTDDVPEAEL